MEFVGLTVAVVSQDLDVIEHRLDDLLINPLKFTLDLEKLYEAKSLLLIISNDLTFHIKAFSLKYIKRCYKGPISLVMCPSIVT